MKKARFNLPVKSIILAAVILLALGGIIRYIGRTLRTAEYFQIKEVVSWQAKPLDLAYFKGRNIFSLDLKKASRSILESYPDTSHVRMAKILPNRIFIDFVKRQPLALVRLYRYFALDKEGVLFNPAEVIEGRLPVITGLETKIFKPQAGTKYNLEEVNLVLEIIAGFRRNKPLRDFKISKIDVPAARHGSIFISAPQQFEIKVSRQNLKEKLALLAGLVTQPKFNLAGVKYIDLRFKEPVIKLKDAQ